MCSFTRGYTRKDYNNFKDMKTKRRFVSPHVKVAETDLEGALLLPGSQTLNVQWDETKNVNKDGDGVGSSLYFE